MTGEIVFVLARSEQRGRGRVKQGATSLSWHGMAWKNGIDFVNVRIVARCSSDVTLVRRCWSASRIVNQIRRSWRSILAFAVVARSLNLTVVGQWLSITVRRMRLSTQRQCHRIVSLTKQRSMASLTSHGVVMRGTACALPSCQLLNRSSFIISESMHRRRAERHGL
jgi:hypothetical protein